MIDRYRSVAKMRSAKSGKRMGKLETIAVKHAFQG